jgi:hypothetical protein
MSKGYGGYMKRVLICCALLFVSCATDSGVVQVGEDTYVITKQAATGFSGMGNLKADALKEAYANCSKSNESVKILSSQESQPPYIFGNFPRIELTFSCVPGKSKGPI